MATTAAACDTAIQSLSSAQTASNQADTAGSAAKTAYEVALAAARSRLSGLREELTRLLSNDDPLWYAFGFDKPSDPETPEMPDNVVVTPGPAGSKMLMVDWGDARRAESYRATLSVAASNAQVAEQIVTDSDCTFAASRRVSSSKW